MNRKAAKEITLSSAYAVMLTRYLKALNHANAFASSNTTNALADGYLERRTPFSEITSLIDAIAASQGNYGFGLDIGKAVHPSDYGLLGYLLMNCETLSEAIAQAVTFKRFGNQGLKAHTKQNENHIFYALNRTHPSRYLDTLVELDFASAYHFGHILAGPHCSQTVKLDRVEFMHQPIGSIERYTACFNCPVTFGAQQDQIVLHAFAGQLPVHGANRTIYSLIKDKLERLQSELEQGVSLSEQTYDYLQHNMGPDLPDSLATAKHFHMSLSAYKKHLKHENQCFQQISDQVRMDIACRLITHENIALKEVGFQLGFNSSSAFNRAFRRWLGMSPAEYRRQQGSLAANAY